MVAGPAASAWRASPVVRSPGALPNWLANRSDRWSAPLRRRSSVAPRAHVGGELVVSTRSRSSVTSRAPSAQSSVAIVDFPMPEAPTNARAASPTCTALAVQDGLPAHGQHERQHGPADEHGQEAGVGAWHRVHGGPGQACVEVDVAGSEEPEPEALVDSRGGVVVPAPAQVEQHPAPRHRVRPRHRRAERDLEVDRRPGRDRTAQVQRDLRADRQPIDADQVAQTLLGVPAAARVQRAVWWGDHRAAPARAAARGWYDDTARRGSTTVPLTTSHAWART